MVMDSVFPTEELQGWQYGNNTGDSDAKYRRECEMPVDGSRLSMQHPVKFLQPWAEAEDTSTLSNTAYTRSERCKGPIHTARQVACGTFLLGYQQPSRQGH